MDSSTDLVTITIGGNDMQFTEVLRFCALSSNCTTERFRGRSLAQYAREQRDALSPRLDAVYARIRSQAPNAQVLVLGYPHLFPETPQEQSCAKIAQRVILVRPRVVVGFSQAEQNFFRQATAEANQLIAARAGVNGATFVPVDDSFAGHEVCGSLGEWINAPTLARNWRANDQSFHPNESGHRLGYAGAINSVLNPR